ncbi:MAG TPA: hypothetical protein PLP29_14440 [Candidatus Ozemobacteraceae bacterium]|nr:hypothetical protein [Candidatus Ozemobacteraceae bacterium]
MTFFDSGAPCANHPRQESVGVCASCGKALCADCLVERGSYRYCRESGCAERGPGAAERDRTSRLAHARREDGKAVKREGLGCLLGGLGDLLTGGWFGRPEMDALGILTPDKKSPDASSRTKTRKRRRRK